MKATQIDREQVSLTASPLELRATLDLINEFLNGPFAITDEQWQTVMIHPPTVAQGLLSDLNKILGDYDRRYE